MQELSEETELGKDVSITSMVDDVSLDAASTVSACGLSDVDSCADSLASAMMPSLPIQDNSLTLDGIINTMLPSPRFVVLDPSWGASWVAGGVGPAECMRRAEVLRRVCAHMLALAPAQRPKSKSALNRTLRNALTVKSFTIHPMHLAKLCNVQEEAQALLSVLPALGHVLDEGLGAVQANTVLSSWAKVSVSLRNSARAVALWMASQAFTSQTYVLDEVEHVIQAMGLLSSAEGQSYEWSNLTAEGCSLAFPATSHGLFPGCPWDISTVEHDSTRALPVPAHCVGALIGKAGASIQAIQSILQNKMLAAGFHKANVMLSVCRDTNILKVRARGAVLAILNVDVSLADEAIAAALRRHVAYLRIDVASNHRAKRQQRQERLAEEGLAYQARLQEQRKMRRSQSAAMRALLLPEGGLAISAPVCPQNVRRGRHRQWLLSCEKRRTLLRAHEAIRMTAAAQNRPGRRLQRESAAAARRLIRQAATLPAEDSEHVRRLQPESAATACRLIRQAATLPKGCRADVPYHGRGKPRHFDMKSWIPDCLDEWGAPYFLNA